MNFSNCSLPNFVIILMYEAGLGKDSLAGFYFVSGFFN